MAQLSLQAWMVVGGIIAVSTTGALYVLASILRDATRRIELHKRVYELRMDYAKRVREIEARGYNVKGGTPASYQLGEFDIVGEPAKKAA